MIKGFAKKIWGSHKNWITEHSKSSDFLVHNVIALGLNTTTLILVKGALDVHGSKLMFDKKDFNYNFPCDGLGRGGTCDTSAWEAFYLEVFWIGAEHKVQDVECHFNFVSRLSRKIWIPTSLTVGSYWNFNNMVLYLDS